jgi:hypothetical protein
MHKKFVKILSKEVRMQPLYKSPRTLVLALLTILAAGLTAAPEAQAAWTAVGTILNANNGTAGMSWAPAGGTSAALEAGNVGVCVLATDETGTGTTDGDNNEHNTPTDAAGNTWIQAIEFANMQNNVAATGANVSIWYTKASATLASGAAITFNFSANTTRKAVTCMEFTIGAGNSVTLAAGANGLANDAADPGSMTDATGLSREHLFIRGTACEARVTTYTADTDYVAFTGQGAASTSDSGNAATSIGARGERRITTDSTSAASDPTYTAADCASAMMALDEYPSSPGTLSFSYRKKITIDHAKVGTTGAGAYLTDYPFLFNVITDADLAAHVTDAEGDDIIFRAFEADNPGPSSICGGVEVCTLDHEIESYTPATGKLVAWVRIPTVKALGYTNPPNPLPLNTVIYIYYGNTEITTSTQNTAAVWDSNFNAVWHMNQDPSQATSTACSGLSSANVVCDSTVNNLDGDSIGSMTAGDLVAGEVGSGIDFDGTDDGINIPSFTIGANFTLENWFRSPLPASWHAHMSNGNAFGTGDGTGHRWSGQNGSQVHWSAEATGNDWNPISTNTWYHVVAAYDGTNLRLYLNGALDTTLARSYAAHTDIFSIAYLNAPASPPAREFFQGILDEMRVSNIARNEHWIKTEYNNMSLLSCGGAFPFDATEFAICDGEEPNPPSAVKLRGARAVSYEGAFAQTVQLKWRTSHEVDHLGFYVYREQAGQLLRVTPSIVAGSALLARGRTELTAGQRYSWWDVLPANSGPLKYWLEEIDLHGQRTWHGPIAVTSAKGRRDIAKPEQVRSVLLSKLGRSKHKGRLPGAPWQGATDAATQTSTVAQLEMQTQLAAGPAIKLGVSAEGWYRVDQPALIAAGLDPKVDPRRLKLFAEGREVPMIVTGAKDRRLEPRDAIEFYGVGLETPWTDTRTYWLVEGQQAGQRLGVAPQPHLLPRGAKVPMSFPYTVTWQPRELYFAGLRNGEADNFFGPVVGNWPTEQAFTLNHLDATAPGAARLDVTLQGVTEGPHVVDVQVNGTSVGTVNFDGQGQGRADLSVPSSQLQAGANLVTLVALGGELDISLVATVRLTYWHTYQAEEDVLRGSVPAGQQVTIGGFSTRPIHVLDVTEPDGVRAVSGQVKRQGSSFAVTVVGPGPGTRTLLAFTDRIAATPGKIQVNQPSQWHSDGHRADLVMIGHPTFLPSLANLKAWREQQGWRVALIDVEDLYDEFTFGAKSPLALRALVETARTRWAQPPRFLLLGGDASFDPRDTQGMGETDFVPTKLIDTDMMETASDDWFGDLDGDGVAEVPVGRLAVRTAEEANTVVQKLIGYDQTAAARTAVLVADTPDSLDFEAASSRLAALLPSGMATQAIYRSQSDDATTRGALLAALNSGAWLVNYLGHGSVEVWRGEVFTSLDASTLTNGLRLPFVSTMTCLNGFFHDVYQESLAEALQRAPQGGALAVWASSSLSQATEQVDMNRALVQGLSAGLTFGEAVAKAKAVARDPNVRRTWILFGDPTTRLK